MERLKIAVVGLNFGRYIVEEIARGSGRDHLELAAVCDLDAAKADAMAADYDVRAYHDLDTLLASDIPAIGLFTGPVGRAALLRRCLDAGKDVLTTKPVELDPDAGLAVLEEACRRGRVIHLNSPGPMPPADIRQILAWQQEYDLGRPVAAQWYTWANYRETDQGSWMDDPAQCPAAPIFRLGIYAINDIVYLLGEPEAVQVSHARIFTGRPTADNALLSIRFRSGALAAIFASFCVNDGHPYPNGLVLSYANGNIYANTGPESAAPACRLELQTPTARATALLEHAERSGAYQWGNFVRAVHGETLPDLLNPAQTVAGIRVIAAMARAQRTARTETV